MDYEKLLEHQDNIQAMMCDLWGLHQELKKENRRIPAARVGGAYMALEKASDAISRIIKEMEEVE